jgi:excisionase family DNA binding protein
MENELTVKELSDRTGVEVRKIMYRITKTGEIKGRKVGWIWLVPQSEVEVLKSLYPKKG